MIVSLLTGLLRTKCCSSNCPEYSGYQGGNTVLIKGLRFTCSLPHKLTKMTKLLCACAGTCVWFNDPLGEQISPQVLVKREKLDAVGNFCWAPYPQIPFPRGFIVSVRITLRLVVRDKTILNGSE